MRVFIYLSSCIVWVVSETTGPRYVASKGEVWPKPQLEQKQPTFYTYYHKHFEFKIVKKKCSILNHAIYRVKSIIKAMTVTSAIHRIQKSNVKTSKSHSAFDLNYKGNIKFLRIELLSSCEDYPHLNMDESYTLEIGSNPTLTSNSIWGIIRGLETFSQLFYITEYYDTTNQKPRQRSVNSTAPKMPNGLAPLLNDSETEMCYCHREVRINSTIIVDQPRYPHRGILLDTSRHYLSVQVILRMLDAMAMNKLNVLHWHMIDDASFPYKSEKFPELSENGAFHPEMVYTNNQIETIITYATNRGIRVIPELDIPEHVRSMGGAYPDILTKCYEPDSSDLLSVGPINPIKFSSLKILKPLIQEIRELFPDEYIHIGGDEPDIGCWASNPDISNYLRKNQMNTQDLYVEFMDKIWGSLIKNSKSTKLMVGQDVLLYKPQQANTTIIQLWKLNWKKEMVKMLTSGYKLIASAPWNLNMDLTFEEVYKVDPRQVAIDSLSNRTLVTNIIGGEANLWSDNINNHNVFVKAWPRASAMAEVLWSPIQSRDDYGEVLLPEGTYNRLEEHSCRMMRSHIPVEPVAGAGFCIV